MDTTVLAALIFLMIRPDSSGAVLADRMGSALVSIYLIITGIQVWKKHVDENPPEDIRGSQKARV